MMFYFVIMKYNLTNETYLPETVSNFPGAPDMNIWGMIGASLFYNIVPLVISLGFYYPIVYGFKKLNFETNFRLILTGFTLTLTTPVSYLFLFDWKYSDFYQLNAVSIGWILCFVVSIGFYYTANKRTKKA